MNVDRVPGQSGVRAAWPAGNVLFPALICKRFKAKFGYDSRKGVAPCDHDPLGLGPVKKVS